MASSWRMMQASLRFRTFYNIHVPLTAYTIIYDDTTNMVGNADKTHKFATYVLNYWMVFDNTITRRCLQKELFKILFKQKSMSW